MKKNSQFSLILHQTGTDMIVCANCEHTYEGNYCPQCGQRANIRPISMKSLWEEVLLALNVDRGLFYTVIQLTRRPGKVLRDYIEGHRVRYMSPLRYLIFTVAVGAFANLFVSFEPLLTDSGGEEMQGLQDIEQIIKEYYTLISMVSIPFCALFSLLMFYRNDRSYARHLVVNAYVIGHLNWVFILLLFFLVQNDLTLYFIGNLLLTVLTFGYISWAMVGYFSPRYRLLGWLKVLLLWTLTVLFTQFVVGMISGFTDHT